MYSRVGPSQLLLKNGPGLGEKVIRSYPFLAFTHRYILSISGDTESGWDDTTMANDLSSTPSGAESGSQSPLTPDGKRSPKGIKKFWGK